MNASARAPVSIPNAFYKCESPSCGQHRVWRPHELRWSPGGEGQPGTAPAAGFYCEGCYEQHARKDAWRSANTLAMELARGRGAVCAWNGTANSVRLGIVGVLVAFPHDVTFSAVVDAPLIDDGGERDTWLIDVGKEWAGTEFLPGDLVRVEGYVCADGECDPFLDADRVDLLRQGFTGSVREELLACSDTKERWHRANQLGSDRFLRIAGEG